jgi:hypothetical protein
VICVVAAAGFGVWRAGLATPVKSRDIRLLLALTTIQEDGSRAADVVAYVRLDPGAASIPVVIVPSTLRVDVPGVSDDRLREVYPYGGARMLGQAFSSRLGMPVDAAVAIDESQAVTALAPFAPINVRVDRDISLFRSDRYETYDRGSTASLDATQVVDLAAASALSEPPGQDVTLQAALVRAVVASVAPALAKFPSVALDEWGDPRILAELPGLVRDSGWPEVEILLPPGTDQLGLQRLYWVPDIQWWRGLFRRVARGPELGVGSPEVSVAAESRQGSHSLGED